ncbi:hypothetical protein [Sphingobacterium sp. MYb382]|uniref:hypothetical protein n=1 Tax=Sphingobacterium sp. MYb382 TaxID=2745278 RepID=UPI0030A2E6B2
MENLENDKKCQATELDKKIKKVVRTNSGNVLLCTSIGILALAAGLRYMGHRNSTVLLGQCAGSLFLFGIYRKLVTPKIQNPTE